MDASLVAILAVGVSLAALMLTGLRSVRAEIRDVRAEIGGVRTGLRDEIAELRTELRAEIAELRTELRAEIAELRTELRDEIAELRTELRDGLAAASAERQAIRQDVQSLAERVARLEGAVPFLTPRRESSAPPASAA